MVSSPTVEILVRPSPNNYLLGVPIINLSRVLAMKSPLPRQHASCEPWLPCNRILPDAALTGLHPGLQELWQAPA